MQLLNIGCGKRIHQDWVNIDKIPTHPSVVQCNVEQGLLFSDCRFDVVYHSHVLEHFEVNAASQLIKECYRVLKPGGVIRIAVPDLEQIVLCYLQTLQIISDGNDIARDNYDWIMLEMYDQVVRNSSGGYMAAFLSRESISNRNFIVERCGVGIESLMGQIREKRSYKQDSISETKGFNLSTFLSQKMNIVKNFRELILKMLLGSEYRALRVGRFRCSGENHQWMYDRISLRFILERYGFADVIQQDAGNSYIFDWTEFNLDTEPDGTIYKPDSLFMEAVKP